MKLTFDYYHNLEKVDFYLCNPDGRELFPLVGKNRNLTLRFNDLSELTFEIDSKTTLSNNAEVELEAYDYIETKRLIYATDIGWFQITAVDEHDNGVVKYKTVTCESYQSVLKNKGFISEERVYCFYNPNDPHDDRYDSTKEGSIPSVLGQWSKQLGIKQALGQGLSEPDTPYDDWTVTYIHSSLIYAGSGSKCRTFKESVTYGYDWMVNDVEKAFEVVVLFDFMYKTIHVMTPNEVAQRVNVIYTFNNFMKSVDINEAPEDIVTVLNCNGDNCDITAVNPTGTNYICDFSYYMDKTNYRWMSSALITKLEQWKEACDAEKDTYTNYVSQLRSLWLQKTQCMTSLQEMSLSLQDLKNAQNKRSVVGNGTPGAICGIVAAENVQSGKKSIKNGTAYYSTAFTGSQTITAYQHSPTYDAANKQWVFSGASKSGTADSIVADNLSDSNTSGVSYWYFSDVSDGSSYCKLQSAATVNKDSATSTYYCCGFDRYIAYSYPIVEEGTSVTTYTDSVQEWINLREGLVSSLNSTNSSLEASISSMSASLDDISSRLNIISYFASTPELLRELNCYWIEGDYTNDNIAVLDSTTPEEEIDLSNELLETGYVELSKMCQPRLSFSLESIDATKQYEFKDQMRLLELGKIITIEKEEGVWYYPALLEISLNLDNSDEFSMSFANAMRLDDWGYTYADLISDASSTSRQVSANWQNILAYSKEREEISSIIKDPLDSTLRASFANMVNQEFTVDKNGILGRKKVSETSDEFEDEQVRLVNNLLIFTDDNWETAKTALGKIYYKDDDGNQIPSYGLIAETIIGSLIMGERLKIKNTDSTIELGSEGITIKNKSTGGEVFHADINGNVTVTGMVTLSDIPKKVSDLINDAGFVNGDSIPTSITQLDGYQQFIQKSDITQTKKTDDNGIEYVETTVPTSSGNVIYKTYNTDDYMFFGVGKGTDKDGSNYFAVDKEGLMVARNAVIYGTVYATDGHFNGDITATSLTLTPGVKVSSSAVDGLSDIATSGNYNDLINKPKIPTSVSDLQGIDNIVYKGDISQTQKTDSNGISYVETVVPTANGNATYKTYDADEYVVFGRTKGTNAENKDYFAVSKEGLLIARNAVIYGTIYASEGEIGGNRISSDGLKMTTGTIHLGNNFSVESDGTLKVYRGYAGCGLLGWNTLAIKDKLNNCYCGMYASTTKPSGESEVDDTGDDQIAFCCGSIPFEDSDFTVTFTARGARATINIYTDKDISVSDCVISSWSIGNNTENKGHFYDIDSVTTSSGYLQEYGVNSNMITLLLDGLQANSTVTVSGNVKYQKIYKAPYKILKNGTVLIGSSSMKYSDTYHGVLMEGNWLNASGGTEIVSWRGAKHDIEPLSNKYSTLFDNLRPVRFKYNDGDSDRYHTGLILDELKDAMDISEVTSQELAAYCVSDANTGAGCIRYSELVALTINEVQKSKSRILSLETRVAELEAIVEKFHGG